MNEVMIAGSTALQVNETASSAVAAQAKAMVEARYKMAMVMPRDIDVVRQRLLKDCKRPIFADQARYNKPVGKGITGPSIRFVEAAIRHMGNILTETITVYDDPEKRIVRVSVCDLESNAAYSKDVTVQKTVERRNKKQGDEVIRERKNSNGDQLFVLIATDDEIMNKENSLVSKSVRALGLRVIPADIVEEAMEQVVITQGTRDAEDPSAAKSKLFDAFLKLGVSATDIKAHLGHSADVLNPKEIAELRGYYNAIKEGETSWREIMDSKAGDIAEDKLVVLKALFEEKKSDITAETAANIERIINNAETKSYAKAIASLKAV